MWNSLRISEVIQGTFCLDFIFFKGTLFSTASINAYFDSGFANGIYPKFVVVRDIVTQNTPVAEGEICGRGGGGEREKGG